MASYAGAVVLAPCDPAYPTCVPLPAGSISAADLECEGHGDIASALVGMHPRDVWVTRLEANLPREALDTDLAIAADLSQAPVTNWMIAGNDANLPTCNPPAATPQPADTGDSRGCSMRSARSFDPAAFVMALMAMLYGARRYSKR